MKIRPVGAELLSMRSDGETNMMKLTVAFRNIVKAPKKMSVPKRTYTTDKRSTRQQRALHTTPS